MPACHGLISVIPSSALTDHQKKMVLGQKTNFFLGKTKKKLFLEFGHIVSHFFFVLFGFS